MYKFKFRLENSFLISCVKKLYIYTGWPIENSPASFTALYVKINKILGPVYKGELTTDIGGLNKISCSQFALQ